MVTVKRCNACQLEFPATREFYSKDSSRKDGLAYRCKTCESGAHKKYYKEKKKKAKKRAAHARYSIIRKQLLEMTADGTVTRQALRQLLSTWTGTCPLCNQEGGKPTIDHIVALRAGGSHTMANLRVICLSCNSSLGTKARLPRPPKTSSPSKRSPSRQKKVK